MSFSNPVWLIGALLLCVACLLAYRRLQQRKVNQALAYTNLAFLESAVASPRWPGRLIIAGMLMAVALMGSALAGPKIVARVPAKDGSVELCIDTSGSMTSTDVLPTRAAAAKAAARSFISETPEGTKIGLITFSTAAEVVQQPSRDRQTVLDSLERIPAPNGATAIGDALALAAQQLPDRGHRVVVLITDGVNNRGADPLEVAKFLAAHHVPVYAIGIGTNDSGQLIPGTSEPASIDEDALRAIANEGAGTYSRASDAAQLKSALAQLGRTTALERKQIDASLPFALAGGLLFVVTFLGGLAAGRFP